MYEQFIETDLDYMSQKNTFGYLRLGKNLQNISKFDSYASVILVKGYMNHKYYKIILHIILFYC